jgi:hypothetical protein
VNSGPSAYKFYIAGLLTNRDSICATTMPSVLNSSYYASAFLRAATFLGFGSAVVAVAGFLEATRFSRALILVLFLETPKEPIVRFPFFVFLSPLPME